MLRGVSDTFQTPVVVTACKHQWVVTACVVHSVGNNRKTIENNVRWYHDVVTTTGVTIHWCLGASAHVPNTSGGDRTQKIEREAEVMPTSCWQQDCQKSERKKAVASNVECIKIDADISSRH